jgi:hypothetical protein
MIRSNRAKDDKSCQVCQINEGDKVNMKGLVAVIAIALSTQPMFGKNRNPDDYPQRASADRVAHAAPITSYIADLERGECEGRTITTFVTLFTR